MDFFLLISLENSFESIKMQSDEDRGEAEPEVVASETKQQLTELRLKQLIARRTKKCTICSGRCTSNELLESHICGRDDDATGNNEISCEYCDQSFRSVTKCMQHLETMHADDRTMYQCRKCVRYFGMLELRDFHEKYFSHVIKPFQCDICSRKFATKRDIKMHMNNVHSGKKQASGWMAFLEIFQDFVLNDTTAKIIIVQKIEVLY